MFITELGYKRLYTTVGCTLLEGDPGADAPSSRSFAAALAVNDFEIHLYISPQPRLPITIPFGYENVIQGDQARIGVAIHSTPDDTPFKGMLLFEIIVTKSVHIGPEKFDEFKDWSKASIHSNLVTELIRLADLGASVVGLKLHPQFIKCLADEYFFSKLDNNTLQIKPTFSIQVHEQVEIDCGQHLGPSLTVTANGKYVQTPLLHWFVKAWTETDDIMRFLALFIPLEIIVADYAPASPEAGEPSSRIIELIKAHANEDKSYLIEFMTAILKPSLNHRFKTMALQAGLAGANNDIKAFMQFNRIRNELLHKGKKNLKLEVNLGETHLIKMQELTEKYVRWAVFSNSSVSK